MGECGGGGGGTNKRCKQPIIYSVTHERKSLSGALSVCFASSVSLRISACFIQKLKALRSITPNSGDSTHTVRRYFDERLDDDL